jgi:hypothetical protein
MGGCVNPVAAYARVRAMRWEETRRIPEFSPILERSFYLMASLSYLKASLSAITIP